MKTSTSSVTVLWMLVFSTLALLAAARTWRCPVLYEAVNKTVRRLVGPTTWLDSDDTCRRHFPGFEVLMEDLVTLSDKDRRLCWGQPVPLGLYQHDTVYWRKEIRLVGGMGATDLAVNSEVSTAIKMLRTKDEEETSDEKILPTVEKPANRTRYLELSSKPTVTSGGLANLTTNQWHLVDANAPFECTLCQRGWLASFDELRVATTPRTPYRHSYSARIVKTGDDDDIDLLVQRLNNSSMDIKVMLDGQGHELVVGSKEELRRLDFAALQAGAFRIESWQDRDVCPATRWQGVDWPAAHIGYAIGVRLTGPYIATRLCKPRTLSDNDFDAVWEDAVYHWLDHEHVCETNNVQKLLRYIRDFASWPPENRQLASLLAGSSQIKDLSATFDDFDSRRGVSTALVQALAAFLSAPVAGNGVAAQCEGTSLTCVMVSPGTNSPVTLHMQFISHDRVPLVYFSNITGDNELSISLEIPIELTNDERFAAHLIHESKAFNFNHVNFLSPTQGFRLLGFDYGAVVHVASTASFERQAAPVVVHVNNSASLGKLQSFRRYLAVWSQTDENGSTRPCPLVATDGAVDEYWCVTYDDRALKKTAGVFYAYQTHNMLLELVAKNSIIENIFSGYTRIKVDESALNILAYITNVAVKYTNQLGHVHTDVGAIQRDVERVATVVDFVGAKTRVAAKEPRVKMLVSDLTVGDPVLGFSLTKLAGADKLTFIEAGQRNVSRETAIDFVVGPQVAEHCDRLAIFAISHFYEFYSAGSFRAHIKKMLMVVHLVLTTSRDLVQETDNGFYLDILIHKDIASLKQGEAEENEYGDLRFDHKILRRERDAKARDEGFPDFDELPENGEPEGQEGSNSNSKKSHEQLEFEDTNNVRRFTVLTWNDEKNDWESMSCPKLKSTRDEKLVIRCEGIAFESNEFRGRFLIFEPSHFAEVLGEALLTILSVAGVLSAVSLTSIVGTAILQPTWRKDIGHKILLQMTLALSFNLALGFTSSLVSVDTASVACIAVGALRHFSYLAMFAWMLVMSVLQLKRLLSVAGARSTSNLLLKASLFAWVLPLCTVAALVAFNTDIYQSDAVDRGFCYPEGDAFLWSVQTPAGLVLSVNAAVFLVILARVYALLGWGETEDLRRHVTQRTVQLRRLRAVFFTFCLFGITWVFHFLAELGVFKLKYLYEYLFLLTASVHVFSLSCIFVFFDKNVREEWSGLVHSWQRKLLDRL